jgi:hypothetical protein
MPPKRELDCGDDEIWNFANSRVLLHSRTVS